jgi:hypothetical protein
MNDVVDEIYALEVIMVITWFFSHANILICVPCVIGEVQNQDALMIWPSFLYRTMSRWTTLLFFEPSCPVLQDLFTTIWNIDHFCRKICPQRKV